MQNCVGKLIMPASRKNNSFQIFVNLKIRSFSSCMYSVKNCLGTVASHPPKLSILVPFGPIQHTAQHAKFKSTG